MLLNKETKTNLFYYYKFYVSSIEKKVQTSDKTDMYVYIYIYIYIYMCMCFIIYIYMIKTHIHVYMRIFVIDDLQCVYWKKC